MAGTIKFFDEMQNASNVSGQDRMMIGKAESGETQVITFDQAKQYLDITSNEIAPIVGGDSEANATPVPAGPTGQTRRADVAPGWIDFGSGPIEAAATNRWMAYWDGSSWSLVDMGELPDNAAKAKDWQTGEEYDRNTIVTHNDLQWIALVDTDEEPTQESTTWEKFSPTPLKDEWDIETQMGLSGEGIGKGIVNNFQGGQDKVASAEDAKELDRRVNFLDRPDLENQHYIVDDRNRVIDRLLSANYDAPRLWPDGMSPSTIDRPDLGALILVDKANRLLGHSGTNDTPSPTPTAPITLPVFNPGDQVGFDRNEPDSEMNSYTDLIAYYDDIMSQANVNPNVTPYVTKRSIGTSTLDDHEIYLYSFTPPEPKVKVLLVGGTHASEKMYIHVLKSFASDLALNWAGNTFLDFLRWNIQIDILPCRMPYTMGNGTNRIGGRISPETAPIPFSWTKTGTQATITFDVNDFPSDGFLSGASYFTSVPDSALNGKIRVGIRTSSDEAVLPPNAYVLSTVLTGNSVVLETEVSGDGSGTGTFQIWTDPNRNIPLSDGAKWNAYYTAYTALMSDDDGVNYGTIVGKGTRPLSLKESRAFLSLIEEENYDYTMDGHAAGGDCYIAYDPTTGFIPNIDKMLAQSGAFVSTVNDKIFDRTNENAPFTEMTLTREHDTPTHLIEWGSGLESATPEQVKDAYRWMTIVLTDSLLTILNK